MKSERTQKPQPLAKSKTKQHVGQRKSHGFTMPFFILHIAFFSWLDFEILNHFYLLHFLS